MTDLPSLIPRRPYDEDQYPGYLESDTDWLRNNNERAIWVLEHSDNLLKAPALLRKILDWAGRRCPCENEEPNPCPLCGASVENLEACKAVEEIFPRELLREIREHLK